MKTELSECQALLAISILTSQSIRLKKLMLESTQQERAIHLGSWLMEYNECKRIIEEINARIEEQRGEDNE